ncbi:MAG: DUF5615 family PIN-like protein [Chlorobiaceae bacterium]|nr:DUF5615 family PIN-like protein [Chlorobiaceae bacterium]
MIFWIDAHLSPSFAAWINRTYPAIQAKSLSNMNLQRADDRSVVEAARKANAFIMSKVADVLKLVDQYGTPHQLLWITCGNTSNARMRAVMEKSLDKAAELLLSGELIIEISDLR